MKSVLERTLAFVGVCTMCIGVTSCGNDAVDEPSQPSAAPVPPTATVQQPAQPEAQAPAVGESVMANPGEAAPQPATPAVQPPTTPSAAGGWSEIENLKKVAQQLNSDFLTPARAWAGDSLQRKLGACEIAKRAGRAADLVMLTREARAACTGKNATFGHLWRIVQYFEAGAALDEAREALDKAVPLADTPARKSEVAKAWRRLWAK